MGKISAFPCLSINPDLVQKLNWLPLTSLIVYLYGNNIGLGPLPWLMNGEIFAEEAKEGFRTNKNSPIFHFD